MPKVKSRLTAALLGAACALLLLPAAGQAATTFGSRLIQNPTDSNCAEFGTCTIASYIHPSEPNGDPVVSGAPMDGVITKFRIRAKAVEEPGQVTFRLAEVTLPDPNDDDSALATAAGTGPTITIQPEGGEEEEVETPIREVAGRLPVKKGQHLAVDTTKSIAAVYNSGGSTFSYVYSPPLEDGSGQRSSNEATTELLVAAVIEPDADGDGFGDETQDQCPTQKTTQGPCDLTPPGVSGLKVAGGKVSYRLSEAATVTFQLARKLPGRKIGNRCVKQTKKNKGRKRCSRLKNVGKPFGGPGVPGPNSRRLPNGKRLKPGRYRLTMTAVDAAGNKTTETTNFKIKKKKKKRRR
jgi:hypothetical protein